MWNDPRGNWWLDWIEVVSCTNNDITLLGWRPGAVCLSNKSCQGYMLMSAWQHTHIRTRAHTHTHARTHTYTCTYTHTHARTHTYHARTHIHMHTHTYTCTHTHACTHTCTHTHTHARTHTYTCAHTHTHARIHTLTVYMQLPRHTHTGVWALHKTQRSREIIITAHVTCS